MATENMGKLIMIKMAKENRGRIKMSKEKRSVMIKIKMIKENRSTTTMIMSKMIKENRSMTVKEANRDLSEPGMQRRSPTMWWRKRDRNIIRIFFWEKFKDLS